MKKAKLNTTSTSMLEEPKCNLCKDSGWITNYEDMSIKKCKCVDVKHLKTLWERSGINADKTHMKFENYRPYDILTNKAMAGIKAFTEAFEEVERTRENWIGLFGQPGAGKTHLVIASGTYLLNKKKRKVAYMPYIEITRELKANANEAVYYNSLINRYCRAELLIIDDLFKNKVKKGRLIADLRDADINHIYPILNYRYNNFLPTAISTECTPDMLRDLDEALAGRILQRCDKNIYVFGDKKYDYRLKNFRKKGN